MTAKQNAYTFHLTAEITVSADITVVAGSQQEAETMVRAELHQRDSSVIDDLQESASEQIRKELLDTDFSIELSKTRDPDEQGE